VVITQRGKQVFVAESFDLPVARKLAGMILGAQDNGPMQNASNSVRDGEAPQTGKASPRASLTGPLVRFMSNCGVTKAVVDAAIVGTRRTTN
jgi:membrane protease subunit (stomatin/prohibitin family)